ncbi:hypothetical protein FACS1894195_5480 [Bacteroidia bacterium]|nr:hypothetical protein FACS1894195_5480 [Bacteroidia bacterium]
MGIVTVIRKMGTIKANIKNCCADMEQWHADVVILVDYGGFNLQIARFAKTHNFKTFYYIAPKIWAWNTSRVKLIKKYVDKTYVIFPFEKDFYRKYNCEVDYEGNPLTDAIYNHPYKGEDIAVFRQENHLSEKPIIALLAGSRRQELKNILPRMLWMVEEFPDYQFVIAGAPSMTDSDYAPYMKTMSRVRIIYGQTYRLLQHARAALVASGTATLEAALLHTPQVVCYTTDGERIYYLIFKYLMKINCVSLVNLIMDGQEVVKELLMQKFTKENLIAELTAKRLVC